MAFNKTITLAITGASGAPYALKLLEALIATDHQVYLLISSAANKFGSQCIVVAIDAKFNLSAGDWEVFTHGGTESTGIKATEFVKTMEDNGAGEILLTSMDKDGVKDGYDLKLLKAITSIVSIPVIASGGAGKVEHFLDAVRYGGASALLAASVFHFNEITIAEVKEFLNKSNIPMRMT